jgi:maltooligosyltrehalose trehalohydrolase
MPVSSDRVGGDGVAATAVSGQRSATRRFGAVPAADGVTFTVWAPEQRSLRLVIEGRGERDLERDDEGYFTLHAADARTGDRYWFRMDNGTLRPDPATRFQPDGPLNASMIVDSRTYRWRDSEWPGITAPHRQVLYELHVGTFTAEGTWDAAAADLPALASLGVTTLEMMPIAEFDGAFGWGYDGVNPFAPYHLYGEPDALRRFIDTAHQYGLAVILDVVYNHVGPSGNFFREFSRSFFADAATEWGDAINFDGPGSAPVREFFLQNVEYWIRDFHFDGLRFDALQSINDSSDDHIVSAMARRARAAAAPRGIFLVGEHEAQRVERLRNDRCSVDGMDALWNDDWHHSAIVRLTGRRDAYFTDYSGAAREFAAMARHGFLYQGQWYTWQQNRRGTLSLGLPGRRFVVFLENHDQVANTGLGQRLHHTADPATLRTMTALLLLGPNLPMMFQGQEFGTTRRFTYFAGHVGDLAASVRDGRNEFLSQFPGLSTKEMQERLPSPSDRSTFEAAKLERRGDPELASALRLHRDLLTLRRADPVLAELGTAAVNVETSALTDDVLVLRYQRSDGAPRLVIVNLGTEWTMPLMNDPLLAAPLGQDWQVVWSSDHPDYGGQGVVEFLAEYPWRIPGRSATFCEASPAHETGRAVSASNDT